MDLIQLEKDVDFGIGCIMSGALKPEEFHQWVENIIETYDDLPTYVFDLYDACDVSSISRAFRAQKARESDELTLKEHQALWGIASKRGKNVLETKGIRPSTTLKRLAECPHIEERFRKQFPFVEF